MQQLIKYLFGFMVASSLAGAVQAQIKIGDLPIDIDQIFNRVKLLKVEKGFSPKSVSYTHLDVYKRQGVSLQSQKACPATWW